jgi:hypothetical protein
MTPIKGSTERQTSEKLALKAAIATNRFKPTGGVM